ncbi:hypothetical protein ID866_3748 [Astraeus odoratus]|nr:hypothetical protein ID866_3748 [Astraeus odoratus]
MRNIPPRETDQSTSDNDTGLLRVPPHATYSGFPAPLHVPARSHNHQDDTATDWGSGSESASPMTPQGEIAVEPDDIIVAVMGPTGAGKSTFIGRAVGSPNAGVGHDLTSFTTQVRAVRYPHSDGIRNIVLVDTPGFDDTYFTDTRVLRTIADWLKETYKQNAKLSGMLYFHRITDPRVAGTPLRNLNMFKELCGKDNFKNVVLVTTMWDELQTDTQLGTQREEELVRDFWQPMIKLGSTTHRFNGTEECAWNIINSISVSQPADRQPLQIQREMVDEHKPVHRTAAGKAVLDSFGGIISGVSGFFRRIRDRARGGKNRVPGHHPTRSPSVSSLSSSLGSTSDISDSRSLSTGVTSVHSSGSCSRDSYAGALKSAINSLKLALTVADFIHARCLKDAIAPSLNIALCIETMEGMHHSLFQVVENAALLIGVVTEHTKKARLSSEMKTAINALAK